MLRTTVRCGLFAFCSRFVSLSRLLTRVKQVVVDLRLNWLCLFAQGAAAVFVLEHDCLGGQSIILGVRKAGGVATHHKTPGQGCTPHAPAWPRQRPCQTP